MHSKLSEISVLAVAALLAACSAAAPTNSPAPPTPAPTAPATAAPTQAPTAPPTATPTAAPTAAPTPAATPSGAADFPNESEALLVSMVLPEYQASCERYPPTYDTELASIQCGPADLPVDYTLFASRADMDAAYAGDLDLGDFPSIPDGRCTDANSEDTYAIDGEIAGRINCRQHTSSSSGSVYNVMEWTHFELLVLSYISNRADLRSWDALINFWAHKAGPFKP
jgi:hypothetical protein